MTPRTIRRPTFVFVLTVLAITLVAQDRFAVVPQKLQTFVDKGEIAGIVALVADEEHVLHLSAVGKSDLATGRALQVDDLFWIASMTKPIAAVALATLVDEGKVSFDDPVEKYIPAFANLWVLEEQTPERRILVKAARPITLRDLLTHTSGLGGYAAFGPHWTLAEMTVTLAREPLRFQPGTRWGYSTAGIDVCCRVAEVAGGVPFGELMAKRVFEPLGMKDTTFWVRPAQVSRVAKGYVRNSETGRLEEMAVGNMYGGAITDAARPPRGGTGLFSTAADVARFYQMMLKGGALDGKRILKPETVAQMTRKHTGDLKARPGMPWGLGFCVIEDPAQMEANRTLTAGTFGHGGAYGTGSWADPTRNLVYVLMLQRDRMGNPDNSPMHIAYQQAVAAALAP